MFHWMPLAPQALKSVFPVADSFSNKKMRTFSRICAHQSTSETNTSLWRRKTKPACFNDFAIVVLATKTCGAFPWRVTDRRIAVRAFDRGGGVGIPAQPAKDCKGNPGSSRFSVFRGGTFLPQTGNWAIPPQLLPESEVSVLWSSLRTPHAPPCRKTYWIALACWASTLTKQRLFHLTISLTNLLRRRLERVWLHEDLGNYSNQLCCDLAAFTWATFAVYD